MEVGEAAGGGVAEGEHVVGVDGVRLQVVVQRAVLVVVRDQEQLGPRARPLDVGSDETCSTNTNVTRINGRKEGRKCFS